MGTATRAIWSRRMEISLLASAVSDVGGEAQLRTSALILQALVLLLDFLLDDDLLLQQRLLLDGAIVLDLHVKKGRDGDTTS